MICRHAFIMHWVLYVMGYNNIELGIHVYLATHDLGLFLILPSSVCECVHVVNLTKITSVNVNYFMC